ncbi:MAG TPA: hypothetical protein VH442_03065 [Micromonosporaceae bacterium]|jgi:hypothetical protein
MDSEQPDLVVFGGGQEPRPNARWRRVVLFAIFALAVAAGIYWSTPGAKHPTTTAAPTGAPEVRSPLLFAALDYSWGYDSGTRRYWLAFNIVPPDITMTSVTASVGPLDELIDLRVLFLATDVAKQHTSEGDFDGLPSLRTLNKGVTFIAVIIGTPECGDLIDFQEPVVDVQFIADGTPDQVQIGGVPTIKAIDFNGEFGPCPTASPSG